MQVVLLTTSYPSFAGDPSGHFVQTHAEELALAGADVTVLAPGVSHPPGAFGPGRIRVCALRGTALFAWPGAAARLRERPHRLASVLSFSASVASRSREIAAADRLVAHWLLPCASLLAQLGRAPLEAWAHGADVRLFCRLPDLVRRGVARALLDRDSRFVFVAADLREQMLRGMPSSMAVELEARSFVSPAPIRVPERATLSDPRAAGQLPDGYVVWVGRRVAEKRPDAAAAIAARAGAPLVLIGDGTLPPPPGTIALGRLGRHDTLRWIAHARALVSTSRHEGAPTAVREARALGVPVVAEPCGDLARWAADDAGIHLARGEQDMSVMLRRAALDPPREDRAP